MILKVIWIRIISKMIRLFNQTFVKNWVLISILAPQDKLFWIWLKNKFFATLLKYDDIMEWFISYIMKNEKEKKILLIKLIKLGNLRV